MQELRFFTSLEQYGRNIVGRSPLPYSWIAMGVLLVVLVTSIARKSMASVTSVEQAIRQAAAQGDYALAEQLYTSSDSKVLGASSELEELVYPKRKVERRTRELEQKLEAYPGNRELYLLLAQLYNQIGNKEKASDYSERARILDPNGN